MGDERFNDLLQTVKLAEQTERYDEMATAMKEIVTLGYNLTIELRNLLSVAFKNIIGARRSAWRIISSIEAKQGEGSMTKNEATKYRKEIETELFDKCKEVLQILDEFLIPQSETEVDALVFYLKMKGDYFRYLAEVSYKESRTAQADNAMAAYKLAMNSVTNKTHPTSLGLALNFSVFHYEIMNNPAEACKVAKEAFDTAVQEIGNKHDSHKDSTLILQLIRDNLTLWTSEENEAEEKVEDIEDQPQD